MTHQIFGKSKRISTYTTNNNMTQTTFKRNANGLIEGLKYEKFEDGRINWRAMIPPQHIIFNSRFDKDDELKQKFGASAANLSYAEVSKTQVVDDKYILILLMGFIELAEIRGYISAPVNIVSVTAGQNVTAQCHITWLPNEEEQFGKTSSGEADATFENTGGFGYLAAIAGNRAFVRAVKRGLRIATFGFDEIAKKDTPMVESGGSVQSTINPLSPQGILKKTSDDLKVTFDQVKKGAITKYREKIKDDPEKWEKFDDISPGDCMTVISLLREKDKKVK